MKLEPGQFGDRLRELRKQSGLTQAALAERASLSLIGVAQLERGVREPTFATVAALAEALGTDCKAFLVKPSAKQPKPKRGRPKGKPQ